MLLLAGGWIFLNFMQYSEPEQTPEPSPAPAFNRKVVRIGTGSRPSGMLFHAVNHYIPEGRFKLEPVLIPDVRKRWTLLAAGDLDLNFSDLSEFVLAASRYDPGKLICFTSSSYGCDGIILRDNIQNPDALVKKNICVVPGSGEHFFLISYLNGIARSTAEVNIVPAGSVSDVYSYFTDGDYLHAAVLTEPYLTAGKKRGFTQLTSSRTSYSVSEVITAGNFALTHRREDLQVIVDAYFNLVNFIKENPGLAKKLVSTRSGMSIEDVEMLFSSIKLKDLDEARAPAGTSVTDAMKKIQQVWVIEGLPNADKAVDFEKVTDFSFMEKSSVARSSPIFSGSSPDIQKSTEEPAPQSPGSPVPSVQVTE
jgi:NitT/TauT family transport system substrate-binding protein